MIHYQMCCLPVEESTRQDARPGQTLALFAHQILRDGFLTPEKGHRFHNPWLGGVGAEFRAEKPLHTSFNRSVNKGLVLIEDKQGRQINDDILAFEGGDDGVGGVGVGDGVDFDVGREGRLGALAGEDGEGQWGFGVDGFDQGGTEIPSCLLMRVPILTGIFAMEGKNVWMAYVRRWGWHSSVIETWWINYNMEWLVNTWNQTK